MVALRDQTRLDDLDRLAGALDDLDLALLPSHLGAERDRLSRTIRDYLIPRMRDPESPLMVVFAGPTGSGKSTLINSLTGLELSVAGPLRPTTTGPVVLTTGDRAPSLDRIGGIQCRVADGEAPILETVTLVDTPDIDSTATEHREISETLIDNADVVVFVTSALRYADAVPWQVLRRAESRGADVIHVLNRVGSSTRGALVDFQARLRSAGLPEEVLVVSEHRMVDQLLPPAAVRPLRRRIASLAMDRGATSESAVGRVFEATLDQIDALHAELRHAGDARGSTQGELAGQLSDRAELLDLTGVGDGLAPRPPGETPRDARRWLRKARRGGLGEEEVERVVASIEARIVGDVRHWMAEVHPSDSRVAQVVSGILPIARLAIEGWIDFVGRIAREETSRRTGLAEAVLISSSTSPMEMTAARLVFHDRADEVVNRARRELTGRLQVIYEQAATHLSELMELERIVVDLTKLRAALAAVAARSLPVDA